MVAQGYNYLDDPIHFMAEFFEISIKYLEESIPPSVPSRNRKKSKKGSKKMNSVIFDNSDYKDSDQEHRGKKFCQYYGAFRHITDQFTTLKALVKQENRKGANIFTRRKGSPNMR